MTKKQGDGILERLRKAGTPADKVRKPETMYKPPGRGKQKAGAVFLWLLIAAMVFLSLGSYLTVLGSQKEEVAEEKENLATGPEAIEFAKLFASTYFTWNAEGDSIAKRAEKLEPMMADDVDDNAGLVIGEIEWDSRLHSARVVEIDEAGDNKALITLAVKQNLINADKKETNETLFTVPVGYAAAFGVYDLPSFAAIETKTEVKGNRLTGSPLATDVEQNVKAFLDTFFQSYTTDTIDKLSYFLEDPDNANGLEGALNFVEVKEATILEGTPGIYAAAADVVLQDPKTNVKYIASYRLQVTEKNGRYIVTQLKGGL